MGKVGVIFKLHEQILLDKRCGCRASMPIKDPKESVLLAVAASSKLQQAWQVFGYHT